MIQKFKVDTLPFEEQVKMRIFVKYNPEGEILSVSKIEVMPEGLEHPYADLGLDEQVLEISVTEELQQLEPTQFYEKYQVDVQKKQLVVKT